MRHDQMGVYKFGCTAFFADYFLGQRIQFFIINLVSIFKTVDHRWHPESGGHMVPEIFNDSAGESLCGNGNCFLRQECRSRIGGVTIKAKNGVIVKTVAIILQKRQ